MRIIITENQHNEFIFKYMSLTVWLNVRNEIEPFHNDKDGTGEISQDDIKSFNIRIKRLIYNYCKENYGLDNSDISVLFELIINEIPDIVENIENKKLFLKSIKLGIKNGIKDWRTFGRTEEGFKTILLHLRNTPFDI